MESRCSSSSNGQGDAPQSSGYADNSYTQLQQHEDDTPPTVFKHYSDSVCKDVKGAHSSSAYSSVLQQQQQQLSPEQSLYGSPLAYDDQQQHQACYQPEQQQQQQQQQQCDYDSYSYDAAAHYDDDFYADCEEVQPVELANITANVPVTATTAGGSSGGSSSSTKAGIAVNREVISLDESSDAEDETAVNVTALKVTAPTTAAIATAAAATVYESSDSFLYEVIITHSTTMHFHPNSDMHRR
jgi:hypothetical protein